MQFPVYLSLGPLTLHSHIFFEGLGYITSFLTMRWGLRTDTIRTSQRSAVIVGGMLGGLIGAKVLVVLHHGGQLGTDWQDWLLLLAQGKTVVGALLGGLIGVEWTKAKIGVTRSTGDAFVFPLLAGTAIGRIGCFLAGLSDRTYGIATSLPWGVDFGDGIPRHPTQLYEIFFIILLAFILSFYRKRPLRSGVLFQIYLFFYLGFRLFVDFLKPDFHLIFGLSAIQIACIFGLLYCWRQLNKGLYQSP